MCDDIILQGIPVEIADGALDLRDRFNCVVKLTDNQVVYIELPKDPKVQRNFLDGIPVYTATNVPKEGIFTWILYTTPENTDIRFAATEVITPFEIGTMHKTLAHLVKASKIHGAGEINRSSDGDFFNTLSGTYTLKWKMEHYEDPVCTPEILEGIVAKLVKPFLPGFKYTSTTFITQSTRIHPDTLNLYRAAGFTVKIFANKAACEADPSTSLYRYIESKRKAQQEVQDRLTKRARLS